MFPQRVPWVGNARTGREEAGRNLHVVPAVVRWCRGDEGAGAAGDESEDVADHEIGLYDAGINFVGRDVGVDTLTR